MTEKIFLKNLGKKIADLRKSKGFTQLEFSEKVGIPRTSLTRIELGNTNCTICMLRKIADELNISLEELVKD